ncbi:MAG: hypothetical protein QNK04_10885 [Myxococcota bacterium]|nr:hypothetical protein [Myxococcota bacterium]
MCVLLVVGMGCGGGENVITGFGNSGNQLGAHALWASVAHELAEHEATPAVTDEDVRRSYGVVRQHALDGELEAALVMLKLAEEQREREEP